MYLSIRPFSKTPTIQHCLRISEPRHYLYVDLGLIYVDEFECTQAHFNTHFYYSESNQNLPYNLYYAASQQEADLCLEAQMCIGECVFYLIYF